VPSRLPSLLVPPIAFAHRGARAHAPENTIEAFQLGLRLGATGLESDVWLTADGVAVLDHDGVVGSLLRRKPISSFLRADLPPHIPTLAELYETCGSAFELSLDIKDIEAVGEVVRVAETFGAASKLWICHGDHRLVASWRGLSGEVKLVDSTRRRRIDEGPERRAAALVEEGIDAVNMHRSDWNGGLIAMFHRFEIVTFAWDCQFNRVMDDLLDRGIDGVYSDHVDRLVDAAAV
jgi:glycerophosphoryl diester phosphodiesterase